MKRCSALLAIMEIKMKTTGRYMLTRISEMRKIKNIKFGKGDRNEKN